MLLRGGKRVGAVEVDGGEVPPAGADEVMVGAELEGVGLPQGTGVGLPEGVGFLSTTYPPVFYLSKKEFDKIESCPKYLIVHGLWEIKNVKKSSVTKFTEEEMENYKFPRKLKRRIRELMPKLNRDPVEHMMMSVQKHGSKISFISSPKAYVEFALDIYEHYEFAGLCSFIADTIAQEGNSVPLAYQGITWTGVTIADMVRIIQSYDMLVGSEISLELFEKEGYFFLYEISLCVTLDYQPARRCKKQHEVFQTDNRKRVIDYNSTVFLMAH